MASVRLEQVPKKYRALAEKSLAGKTTRSDAIKTMCYSCVGWEGSKKGYNTPARTLSEEISGCTSPTCPLFHLRPHR